MIQESAPEALPPLPTETTSPHRHRRHRQRRRHRGRTVFRSRMRFAWWQLWLALGAIVLAAIVIRALQPWSQPRQVPGTAF